MFRVVVHRKVNKELKNLQKAHLRKFAELLEVLKTDPFLGENSTLKRLKARKTLIASESEISG